MFQKWKYTSKQSTNKNTLKTIRLCSQFNMISSWYIIISLYVRFIFSFLTCISFPYVFLIVQLFFFSCVRWKPPTLRKDPVAHHYFSWTVISFFPRMLAKDQLITLLQRCEDVLQLVSSKKMKNAHVQLKDLLSEFNRLDSKWRKCRENMCQEMFVI